MIGDKRRAAVLIVTGPTVDLERLRLLAPSLCVLAEVADGEHVWVTHPDREMEMWERAWSLWLSVRSAVKRLAG